MKLLSVVTFLPILGTLLLVLMPRDEARLHKAVTLVTTLLVFLASLALWGGFDPSAAAPEFQFDEFVPWIPSVGIGYHVGLDGVALLLVMLTTVLMPIVVLSAWNAIQERAKEFMIALLVLETAMLGTFAALDLVLFYVFWELMLVPMYLLIGIWGGANRLYATVKFFVYTFVGQRADAGRDPVRLLPRRRDVRLRRRARRAPGHARRGHAALRRLRPGLRGQGADVPAPHLAARRPHRGADGRVGDPGRRAAEDGHLRLLPLRAAALPRGGAALPGRHRGARRHRHRLRRAHVLRAARHEAAGRVLVGLAPRLRDARPRGPLRRGAHRRRLPDAEPRRLDRRPLPHRRHALRAAPHAR